MPEQILNAFKQHPNVEAIAIGGSRAGTHFDAASDYDIYVYVTQPVPEEFRRQLFAETCSYVEVGNHFWEYEDNGTLNSGTDFDLVYRSLDDFIAGVSAVVDHGQAHNGYTTCMWHNLIHSRIVYDRDGRLTHFHQQYTVPYPDRLRENIIERNMRLLHNSMPAYDGQIRKAARRGDAVSINHRTAEFLASYFDVIFALNRRTHPGEKRLIQLCRAECPILPEHFEENLNALFQHMFHSDCLEEDIERILRALQAVLDADGIR
ncbi:MAG: DUF4037 domain-containing protein [Butyricicoccaceae bacterium]